MGLILVKGQRQSIGLAKVTVELGWECRLPIDFDVTAWCLDGTGKTPGKVEDYTVYYERKETPDGALIHSGDNRGQSKDKSVETIEVDFSKMAAEIEQIMFTVSVYEEGDQKKNFGQVKDSYILVKDGDTEIMRYDLTEDFSISRGVIFGRGYLRNGEWKFEAVGESVADCSKYPNAIAALEKIYGK